jgi:hypothetical protein
LKSHHNDARYPGSLTIHYPFHPLYGRELPVARRFGAGGILRFELQADDRCVLVPAWMTDAEMCGNLTAGDEPRVSLAALLQLSGLLKSDVLQAGDTVATLRESDSPTPGGNHETRNVPTPTAALP